MKSGVSDPNCAQIALELNVASVSAESHGLTLPLYFTFGLYFWTLLLDFTFDVNFWTLLLSQRLPYWGEWEREKVVVAGEADLTARGWQRVELELVGGRLVHNAGQRGRRRAEEHGAAISRRRACRVVGGAATKPESTEGHRWTA